MAERDERRGGLERAITPRVLLILIVDDILGAGIFAVVGKGGRRSAERSGLLSSSPSRWPSSRPSYAEMVEKYPRADGARLTSHFVDGQERGTAVPRPRPPARQLAADHHLNRVLRRIDVPVHEPPEACR